VTVWALRPALPSDAADIAAINVRTWQHAYRGLLPDAYLDGLSIEARVDAWAERLANPGPKVAAWIAVDADGRPVGYAISGPYRDGDLDAFEFGELFAIYVEPEWWGSQAGRELLEAAEASLREAGFERAALWMLDGNGRAGRFYERHGWAPDGGRKSEPFDESGLVVAAEVRLRKLLDG
jgi:GNAT superfamily N-acetyltransferase